MKGSAKVDANQSAGLVFEVPLRTGAGQNDREHWRAKAHRIKREKESIRLALKAYQPVEGVLLEELLFAMTRRGPVLVTLIRIAPSNGLDGDNLSGSLKAVRDAVADAMGKNDRESDRLAWQYAQERGPWGVRVEVSVRKPEVQGPGWTAEEWKMVANALDASSQRWIGGGYGREGDHRERLAEHARAMARAVGSGG